MNQNKNIHEAVKFILASLEAQGQAPGTLKNYKNSFSVFEKHLKEQKVRIRKLRMLYPCIV